MFKKRLAIIGTGCDDPEAWRRLRDLVLIAAKL
jgi:hypothetical protein